MKKLFFLAITTLILGCSKDDLNKSTASTFSRDGRNMVTIVANHQVECGSIDACPENVGRLITIRGEDVHVCTSFLIDKDVLATNRHCVDDIPNDCQGKVAVKFLNGESRNCLEILDRGTKKYDNVLQDTLDFAFIKLDSPFNQEPLEFSNDSVSNEQELTAWRYDLIEDGSELKSVISPVKCSVTFDSVITPHAKTMLSPLIGLANCPIRPGNSGSPLVDEKNGVQGILYAGLFKDGEGDALFAMATNGKCLCPAQVDQSTYPGCQSDQASECKIDYTNNAYNQELFRVYNQGLHGLNEYQDYLEDQNGDVNSLEWLTDFNLNDDDLIGDSRGQVALGVQPLAKCLLSRDPNISEVKMYCKFSLNLSDAYTIQSASHEECGSVAIKGKLQEGKYSFDYHHEHRQPSDHFPQKYDNLELGDCSESTKVTLGPKLRLLAL